MGYPSPLCSPPLPRGVRFAEEVPLRFMVPLSPPPDVATLDQYGNCTDPHAIEKVAQFVSMLPFLRDSDLFENMNVTDLWLNSQEFVNFGYSDWEEHAILLANYFLAIDKYRQNNIETYCLIGEAIPEGDTVFVLRKCKDPEEGSKTPAFEIWNPDTGVISQPLPCFSAFRECSP